MDDEEIKLKIQAIRDSAELPSPPPSPRLPDLHADHTVRQKVFIIQRFIACFQYNYTGRPFVKMQKNRGMKHISSCAKQIIHAALPIQCVEAVFLGCLLTAGMTPLDRVPLSFKSKFGSNTHRHIVLAVRFDGKWGAIGISRRANLMNKDIRFDSLPDMVEDYKRCYEKCRHRLVSVYVGLPFSHDVFSDMPVKWKVLKVNVSDIERMEYVEQLNHFTTTMGKMFEYFRREGTLPSNNSRREQVPVFRRSSTKKTSKKRDRTNSKKTLLDGDANDEGSLLESSP